MRTPKEKDNSLIFPSKEFYTQRWRFGTQKRGDIAEPIGCPICGNKKIYLYGKGWYCDTKRGGCGYTIDATAFYQGRNSKTKEFERIIDKCEGERTLKDFKDVESGRKENWILVEELKQKLKEKK